MKEVWRKIWFFKVTRTYLYACCLCFSIAFRGFLSWTLLDPFSAATETLVSGNLFKLERFAITFAQALAIAIGARGGSAYEKGGDARRKFWIKPLKETDLGVAQAFLDP